MLQYFALNKKVLLYIIDTCTVVCGFYFYKFRSYFKVHVLKFWESELT